MKNSAEYIPIENDTEKKISAPLLPFYFYASPIFIILISYYAVSITDYHRQHSTNKTHVCTWEDDLTNDISPGVELRVEFERVCYGKRAVDAQKAHNPKGDGVRT